MTSVTRGLRDNNDLEIKNKKLEEPQVKWLDIVTRTMAVFMAESRCDCHPFSWVLQQSLLEEQESFTVVSALVSRIWQFRETQTIVNSFQSYLKSLVGLIVAVVC